MNSKNTTSGTIFRRGFTLIELLIVVAIIGILASALLVSLGGARRSARDARRVADLRNMQSVLELYYNKCGIYPGNATCAATPIPASWTELETTLNSANILVTGQKLPNDPTPGRTYNYGTITGNQNYLLQASLEADNAVLANDIDGSQATAPNSINCDDASPSFNYCVGL